MSIEEVASRTAVGKTTIYRRWPSKGLLLGHLPMTNRFIADVVDVILAGIQRPPPAPLSGSVS